MANGKGSSQRPRQISKKDYDSNWDRIFNKSKEKKEELKSPPTSMYNTNNSNGTR